MDKISCIVWSLALSLGSTVAGCATSPEAQPGAADPAPTDPGSVSEVFFAHGAQRPGEGENPIVFEWEVEMTNFRSSGDALQVRRDRAAVHTRVADRPADAFEHRGTIAAETWEQVLQTLRDHHACALRQQGEQDHEEPSGILALDVAGLRCRVVMPEGDWARDGDATAVRDAIQRLMSSLAPPAP